MSLYINSGHYELKKKNWDKFLFAKIRDLLFVCPG